MRLVSRLQNMRHAGDYDDMFDWAEEDVKPLFNRTELLILKSASNLNGNLNCSKELEHYAS